MTTPHTDTTRALPTGTWRLHPAQTTIAVAAKKLGLFRVPATLTVSSGAIEIDASHQVTGVEVVADASSYTSRSTKRNDHIRSADFLDADQHPNLVFRAGQVTPTAAGYRADGSVTVKAQTFPLSGDISNVEFDTHRYRQTPGAHHRSRSAADRDRRRNPGRNLTGTAALATTTRPR